MKVFFQMDFWETWIIIRSKVKIHFYQVINHKNGQFSQNSIGYKFCSVSIKQWLDFSPSVSHGLFTLLLFTKNTPTSQVLGWNLALPLDFLTWLACVSCTLVMRGPCILETISVMWHVPFHFSWVDTDIFSDSYKINHLLIMIWTRKKIMI